MMTRWGEIAGIVVGLALLVALYAAGFWWWVLPKRATLSFGNDNPVPGYVFHDNVQGRTLYYLYWPVTRVDVGKRIFWTADL